MLSTLPSNLKNLTVVLSPLTDNNNKKIILPYELDSLQKDKNASRTINTYTLFFTYTFIFQLYLISERFESL